MSVNKRNMTKENYLYILSVLFLSCLISCTSDIEFKNETFESLLVIDATITNELKQQEILLSRTFPFGEEPILETGAMVTVIGDGTAITFNENEAGIYKSITSFSAAPNVVYQLKINTSDGRSYTSAAKTLTTQTQIDAITVDRITNDDGVDGIGLFVDSFDPTNTSKFYKYEYVETFKVIAPLWDKKDAVIADVFSTVIPICAVALEDRPIDQIVCYRTEVSNQLNITTTTALFEDKIDRHLVRFLSSRDYKVSHRYSLLVRQFVLSEESYNYLETLNRFASEGSVFSQVQTGFLVGNIFSDTNSIEKVIGFFEVASVNEQRVFFNYQDFYPNTALPPFAIPCGLLAPAIKQDPNTFVCGGLINIISSRLAVYLRDYDGNPPISSPAGPGPYYMIPRACGDCTALGTNIVPDFWTE
ncbi:MAG: hypothetical protein ACJA1Z_002070 [Patiriisocius sp.]|jgi:hypothetical protein